MPIIVLSMPGVTILRVLSVAHVRLALRETEPFARVNIIGIIILHISLMILQKIYLQALTHPQSSSYSARQRYSRGRDG